MPYPDNAARIRAHGLEPGQIVRTFDVRGEDLAMVVGATEYRLLVEYPSGEQANWVAEKLFPVTPEDEAEYRRQVNRERLARRLLAGLA